MTLATQVPDRMVKRRPVPTPDRPAAAAIDAPPMPLPTPVLLVLVYVLAMPFLAGLPRGTGIPLLRMSEVLQLSVTGAAMALAALALASGRRWRLRIQPVEWWLLAVAATASVLPVLWLVARGLPVGQAELLGAFPFVKYLLLYALVRGCVSTTDHLETLSRGIAAAALVLAAIAVTQALRVGPVVDVLGRFYVSGVEDLVDDGRGTTTLGSSIATGALLAFSTGVALSWGLVTGRRGWFAVAAALTVGTLASGQAGSVIALGVVVLTVAHLHGRTAQLVRWGLPASALAVLGLWPVVAARLGDLDQGTGLPSSWLIRWSNISDLYLPSLVDGGWVLGVSPNAILAPPDVWRDSIYLESGYLWLLWVGGVPLFVAAVGLLVTAWRGLGAAIRQTQTDPGVIAVAAAARGAVAMMVLLSLIDPHLSLRGGADLFFVLLALSLAATPVLVAGPPVPSRVRALMAADRHAGRPGGGDPGTARDAEIDHDVRVVLSEVADDNPVPGRTRLRLTARNAGRDAGAVDLVIAASGARLRATAGTSNPANTSNPGRTSNPADTSNPAGASDTGGELTAAIVWRHVFLVARSLRLEELQIDGSEHPPLRGPGLSQSPDGDTVARSTSDGSDIVLDRNRLRTAVRLAERLEAERRKTASGIEPGTGSDVRRDRTATGRPGDPLPVDTLPGLRLDPGHRLPAWKRAADLLIGSVAIVATGPLWLLTAFAVRRSSTGPMLYRQLRIGTGGFPFQILKFRTMYVDNDDSAQRAQNRREILENVEAVKDDADPRITPVGRFLRRTSLDELPQLLNVLRAEMSLVGPRPSLLWETELFQPASRRRLRSRPGITGLWQVSGRADLSMSEMLALDLDYVDRMSPRLDVTCLARTATSVVAGRGAR
ncbi:MAG: sugar transferase [Actinomycetota bacterium]